ncbi:MAG: DUF58 domain-containing protein [Planctomycetota bacterium]
MATPFDDSFRRRLEVLKRIVARAWAGRGGGGRSPISERGGRVEFADHRPYAAGDDPRNIDWAAYARLETLVVKEFEAPREAHLLLLVDRSASMDHFGKREAALRLAAALGYLGLAAGARVAVAATGGASRWWSGTQAFPELLTALESLGAAEADYPRALQRAPAAGAGRRTAILIGDLYEAEPLARALTALGRAQRLCVQVIAPAEITPPDGVALHVEDAETGETLEVPLDSAARSRFRAEAERFLEERASLAQRHGARFARVRPEDDLIGAVEQVLLGRAAS